MNTDIRNKRGFKPNLKAGIILMLLLIMVAGCSKAEQASTGESTSTASESTESTNGTSSSDSEANNTETRTVEGIKGPVDIPAEPKRIAGLTYAYADHLVALGMKPYAMVTQVGQEMPAYLKDKLEGVVPLGSVNEFNKEALLDTEPDLILSNEVLVDEYDAISAIGPVYMSSYFSNSLEWFKDTAKVLGKEKEADEIVDQLYQKAKDLGTKVAASDAADDTILIFRLTDKQIQVFAPSDKSPDAFYSPNLLYDIAGLHAPDLAKAGIVMNEVIENVSLELLPELNPDRIFMIISGSETDNEQALTKLRDNAVWKGLKAVKSDQVYMVDNTVWVAGFGPIAYGQVLDEVEQALLGN